MNGSVCPVQMGPTIKMDQYLVYMDSGRSMYFCWVEGHFVGNPSFYHCQGGCCGSKKTYPMLAGDRFADDLMILDSSDMRKSCLSFLIIWLMRCLMMTSCKV